MKRVCVLLVHQLTPQQQNSTILQLLTHFLTVYFTPAAGGRPSILFTYYFSV
jgi:hypothetical protein